MWFYGSSLTFSSARSSKESLDPEQLMNQQTSMKRTVQLQSPSPKGTLLVAPSSSDYGAKGLPDSILSPLSFFPCVKYAAVSKMGFGRRNRGLPTTSSPQCTVGKPREGEMIGLRCELQPVTGSKHRAKTIFLAGNEAQEWAREESRGRDAIDAPAYRWDEIRRSFGFC